MRKAIFLGVSKFHSNKKNKDYRKVDFYTPPFTDSNGFERGGVMTCFTAPESTLGNGIPMGAIVRPDFEFDPYTNMSSLTGLTVVADSPYEKSDLEG